MKSSSCGTPTLCCHNSFMNIQPFQYISALNTVHIIQHNLNTLNPILSILRYDNNKEIIPQEMEVINSNTIRIILSVPRSIRGKII